MAYGTALRSGRIPQNAILRMIQQDDRHVYALLTRDGAIKIGVTWQLDARKYHIAFGGVQQYLGFIPGDYADEQDIHNAMADDVRIPGHREYYYPLYEHVLAPINAMRQVMGIPLLNRRDLPRTGYWAARLPRPTGPTSWPTPLPWSA